MKEIIGNDWQMKHKNTDKRLLIKIIMFIQEINYSLIKEKQWLVFAAGKNLS